MSNREKVKVWVRSDDISSFDDRFCRVMDLYKKYYIYTVFCAVPTVIDKKCFDYIKGYPNFDISQHGYSHKNFKSTLGLEYDIELSDRRNIDTVLSQVLEGKKKLEDLSEQKIDILTPPFNRIDPYTEKRLSEYYSTLSTFGDHKSSFSRDLNPCIDIIDWNKRVFNRE